MDEKEVRKIKVNGEIIELTDCCHWKVLNGVLWNLNTQRSEGVEGDIVTYRVGNQHYRGHVEGYTCYQIITTHEWGTSVLSAQDFYAEYTHLSPVEVAEYVNPHYASIENDDDETIKKEAILTEEILERNGFKKTEYKEDDGVHWGTEWTLEDDCEDTILTLFKISNAFCTNLQGGMTLAFRYVGDLERMLAVMGSSKKLKI